MPGARSKQLCTKGRWSGWF